MAETLKGYYNGVRWTVTIERGSSGMFEGRAEVSGAAPQYTGWMNEYGRCKALAMLMAAKMAKIKGGTNGHAAAE